MKQFEGVNCNRGAPMVRSSYGEAKSIRQKDIFIPCKT
jgi:hypothetical protein